MNRAAMKVKRLAQEFSKFMQRFQNVLKWVSDSAKVGNCKRFIRGQKENILTRVTSIMLSSSQQNCSSNWLVLKPMNDQTMEGPRYNLQRETKTQH